MKTLQELQDEAHATAVSKGWHEKPLCSGNAGGIPTMPDHDRILAKHALIHSEITEAENCYNSGELTLRYEPCDAEGWIKPEGFEIEVADVIIRILDTAGALGLRLPVPSHWLKSALATRPAAEILGAETGFWKGHACGVWVAKIRGYVDGATEAVRVDDWGLWSKQLACAVQILASICAGLGLDLGEALDAKMAYNKTRPHRHGGKSA